MRVLVSSMFLSLVMVLEVFGQGLKCDMTQYKGIAGLTAAVEQDLLVVTWAGQAGSEVRARYAIERGQPVVRDLAVRKPGGQWAILGQNLTPEYHVVSGVRRMGTRQESAFKELGIEITQKVIDANRWYTYHDAPLEVPGTGGVGLPRKAEEVRRASATFNITACSVKTDGARLEVTFPGLSMGIFSGSLQFTVYRGTNLIRMDAVAKTDEQWVAYKFDAGLKGFSTDLMSRLNWLDTGGSPQKYEFGGVVKNDTMIPLKVKNRVLVAEGQGGSLATFPMPHKYFWPRQIHKNLGYLWYRKDAEKQFGMGVRQAEHEESMSNGEIDCYALYNAPPGTWQRMGMYFYASPEAGESTRQAVLAFTHGDSYKPVPGYKTYTNHWHISFTERLRAAGLLETPKVDPAAAAPRRPAPAAAGQGDGAPAPARAAAVPRLVTTSLQDIAAMKALGLNIVGLSDFHGDLNGSDSGALRFRDQKAYADGCRIVSDKDFLCLPWEEPNFRWIGGHQNIMLPNNVYYSKMRTEGQPLSEIDPVYGKVYHLGSMADLQQFLDTVGGYWNTAHPRTKNSAGYPDAYFEKDFAKNDRYLGVDFTQAMGVDLSTKTTSEWRVFDAIDTMNNLYTNSGLKPKNFATDIDTYQMGPEDDLYPEHQTMYLKLDRLPAFDEDWSPILKDFRDGNYFSTTGEVLIPYWALEGTGNKRTITADVEWTFPLEFIEVVWGDGKKVDRQIVSATDLPAFGSKRFSIPFDATGKSWVRFAVWDSAGNSGFVNPVWVK